MFRCRKTANFSCLENSQGAGFIEQKPVLRLGHTAIRQSAVRLLRVRTHTHIAARTADCRIAGHGSGPMPIVHELQGFTAAPPLESLPSFAGSYRQTHPDSVPASLKCRSGSLRTALRRWSFCAPRCSTRSSVYRSRCALPSHHVAQAQPPFCAPSRVATLDRVPACRRR